MIVSTWLILAILISFGAAFLGENGAYIGSAQQQNKYTPTILLSFIKGSKPQFDIAEFATETVFCNRDSEKYKPLPYIVPAPEPAKVKLKSSWWGGKKRTPAKKVPTCPNYNQSLGGKMVQQWC